jgi:hypothetical protein
MSWSEHTISLLTQAYTLLDPHKTNKIPAQPLHTLLAAHQPTHPNLSLLLPHLPASGYLSLQQLVACVEEAMGSEGS